MTDGEFSTYLDTGIRRAINLINKHNIPLTMSSTVKEMLK